MNEFNTDIANITRDIYIYGRYDDINQVVYTSAKYYERAIQSPTIARLLYKDTFHKCDKEYRDLIRTGEENLSDYTKRTLKATQNALEATNSEPAKSALKAFSDVIDRDYKHSEWIREFSVDTNRVVMDKVKGKASWWHKFKVGMFMKKNGIKHFFK